ncbi:hypothetical protein [Desulfogranum mediterraneum]|uniref:hypothetical protein n=1 Tax=Desulfogranum mediterraneum TaxID=160661 RepID=UPI0004093587|nr:hypothetical protein [Desulfogranum mediterraneum]
MPLQDQAIDILTILWDNLQQDRPPLVPAAQIAEKMEIHPAGLEPALKVMKGMGVIESDPDLHYTLITRKGLEWLQEKTPQLRDRQIPCMQGNTTMPEERWWLDNA